MSDSWRYWMHAYGFLSLGVAVGVAIMAILAVARERDDLPATEFDNDQVNGEEY